MRVIAIALFFASAIGCATADDLPHQILGIKLHAPLNIQECAYTRIDSSTIIYTPPSSGACYQIDSTSGRTQLRDNDSVTIEWDYDSMPRIAKGGEAMIQIVQGNVEGIGFNTLGVEWQQENLKSLTEKFGAPSKISTPIMSNMFGAEVQVVDARWILADGVIVNYNSAEDGIDSGLVSISTPIGRAYNQEQLKKLSKNATPL